MNGRRGLSKAQRNEFARRSFRCLGRKFRLGIELGLKLALSCAFALASATNGRGQAAQEYEVKSAFLYNFTKFVEWPPGSFKDDRDPLVIGYIGNDEFGSTIERTVSGRTVNGRQLKIRRFRRGQSVVACHVLFIGASERDQLAQIFEGLKGASILTVGETNGFGQYGGIINLFMEESKVRFEINLDAVEQSRLKISSKLLSLAKIVRGGQRAGRN
jgi:hypothetical protein